MMKTHKSGLSRLKDFADGNFTIFLDTTREAPPPRMKKKAAKKVDDKTAMRRFLKQYNIMVVVISLIFAAVFISAAIGMPTFGSSENPTNNEVVARYVGMAEEETGAENVIAGMILNYRGFDTFGESNVLFLAVCCVMLLLMKPKKAEGSTADDKAAGIASGIASAEELSEGREDPILSVVSRILIPCVLVFGVCVLCNGHTSPGGGFSGGSVLGAALILMAIAFGQAAVHRFFTRRVFNVVRIVGLMIYAVMFGVYIFQGANGIASNLAHYIVLVIDIAVGLVVMSTMYGFYSFYTKGDL